ncbi:MAG: bifunctional pyr operon transcriptional regulator/uracil phosphoribosyltransferase PyrR [Thiothrix sp.]|nr:bifunctional pyr operon transcriptional regulator/uracil phosphoribosyltransferase PyrR [Thiothrix sp.]HPQ95480.1 bifunctional pyr operon transcriptional regulator/uracil phosphoribosyltransferase PyrR [Thiolinea sp.]
MANNNYNLEQLVDQLVAQLQDYIRAHQLGDPVMVGIHRSGVWLAQVLHQRLGIREELGEINVSFYRDDFRRSGLPIQTQPTRLPLSLEDRHVLLIDDVIHSGRTVRAALNELFDYGRPASVTLAVLVARQHRELPIEPQLSVLQEEPGRAFNYQISGPEPMTMTLVRKAG